MLEITICLTAYNEKENLPQLFKMLNNLSSLPEPKLRFIVVDNGSTDGSLKKFETLANSEIRVKSISPNRMYGGGMKAAVLAAETDVVCTLPADNQYSSEDILLVINKYISRDDELAMAKGSRVIREDPPMVVILSKSFNLLSRLILGLPKIDVNSMPKVFNKSTVADYFNFLPDDQLFDAGLCMLWKDLGGFFVEVPVTFHNRTAGTPSWGTGKLKLAKKMFKSMLKLKKDRNTWIFNY